jgi:hypothetical protein
VFLEKILSSDKNDIDMPSSSTHQNVEMNDVLDLKNSNQVQQSANAQPATRSDAIDIGERSTNEGEQLINTESIYVTNINYMLLFDPQWNSLFHVQLSKLLIFNLNMNL